MNKLNNGIFNDLITTNNMNIEKIVEEHARKLKEEVGYSLNGDECFDLINDAVTEAIELVKSNSVLGDVSQPFADAVDEITSEGLGCGLEDCSITDRYEAMEYGFEQAKIRADEAIKNVG